MERSLSVAQQAASTESEDDLLLRKAMEASLLQAQADEDAAKAREASLLQQALQLSQGTGADVVPPPATPTAAGAPPGGGGATPETAAPPPYMPPPSLARPASSSLPPPPTLTEVAPPPMAVGRANSVRDLEDQIARTNGYEAAVTTAAAVRSSRQPSTSHATPLPRSDSIKACYAAQTHFVLTQLTRESLFEPDSDSDSDSDAEGEGEGEGDAAEMTVTRTVSKFV